MRVLIVEDDAAARRGLTELVRAWGYEADNAADGQEGLEKVTTYRPSVVLADMVMPRMDGLDLLRQLKDQLSDLTFVLITAQGSVDTAVSAMKEGAYDYLAKPVEPQRLRTLLTHVAERENALRDVAGLRRQLQEHGRFGEMVGSAPALRSVYKSSSRRRRPPHRCSCTASQARARSWSPRPFISSAGEPSIRSSRSTARRFPSRCSKTKSSATSAAPSRGPWTGGPAASSWPIRARSSSTRLPRSRRASRPSCCACCRSERYGGSAARRSRRSTSV